jgi:hypothetical protein
MLDPKTTDALRPYIESWDNDQDVSIYAMVADLQTSPENQIPITDVWNAFHPLIRKGKIEEMKQA